jgi:hypothetical protein
MKKIKLRSLHRDFGYFYIGLIISFSLSGIIQNHRKSWHPDKYTVATKAVSFNFPNDEKQINEEFTKDLGKKLGIEDEFRRSRVKEGKLQMSFEKNDVEFDLITGKGEITTFNKTPFINEILDIHKNDSNWWIYYSDIFALGLITIAVTGAFMVKAGKFSFKQRGWKLALAGIVFPLIFLFLLS